MARRLKRVDSSTKARRLTRKFLSYFVSTRIHDGTYLTRKFLRDYSRESSSGKSSYILLYTIPLFSRNNGASIHCPTYIVQPSNHGAQPLGQCPERPIHTSACLEVCVQVPWRHQRAAGALRRRLTTGQARCTVLMRRERAEPSQGISVMTCLT